jgi:hypothetical protein
MMRTTQLLRVFSTVGAMNNIVITFVGFLTSLLYQSWIERKDSPTTRQMST